MIKLKKKTLACAALLSGAIVGFVSVTAIDFACRKDTPLNKEKPKVNPQIGKYLPWLKQQHFETWEMTSHDGLKLKAKFLKAERETNKVLIAVHGYRSYNLKEYAYYIKFYHDLGFHI